MSEWAHMWIKLEPNLHAGNERSGYASLTAASTAVDCRVYLSSADNITPITASTDLISAVLEGHLTKDYHRALHNKANLKLFP